MDPTLKAHIHSNEPLSDSEAVRVRLLIDDTLKAIHEIGCDIRNLTSYAATLKGALSFIRQIPSEILAEIFLRCRDNDLEDKYYYYISNPRVAPMLLSQVSHRWRQVSHGTPRLWDHFHLTDPVVNRSIMEHILQRSNNLPLDVQLGVHSAPWLTGDVVTSLTSLVLQQHNRIAHLQFQMWSLPFPRHAFVHGKPFHRLNSLSLVLPPGCDVVWPLSVFTDAPRLQVLDICAEETPMSSLIPLMPWSQLTHIKLELPMDFAHTCDILAQCKSVVQCHLGELIKDNEDFAPPQHMCQLDHLVEFNLAALIVPEAFFDDFTFPGLLQLTIHSHGPILNTLVNLHNRSQFSLTHFTVSYVRFNGEELIEFLCHLPTLEVLELDYCRVDAALLAAFTYSPATGASPLVLPLLQSLKFGTHYCPDGLLLAAMVESMSMFCGGRNLAFPVLMEVHLYLELVHRFDDEVEDRLGAACASGMVVNHLQKKCFTMHSAGSLSDDSSLDTFTSDDLGPDGTEGAKEPTPLSPGNSEHFKAEEMGQDEFYEPITESSRRPPPPRQCEDPPPPDNDDVLYRPTAEFIAGFPPFPAGINEKFPLWRFEAVPREELYSTRYAPPPRYISDLELVPLEEWTTPPIPRSSKLHDRWNTSGWELWAGLKSLTSYPSALNRSRIGVYVKEGYGIRGKIRPVAYADFRYDPEMIFTTTFDEHQYYRLKDWGTIVKIRGNFPSLQDFWAGWSKKNEEAMDLSQHIVDTTNHWHSWLIAAFLRSGGDLSILYSYMTQSGGTWWEFCEKCGNLKQILVVFANLVDADKKMLADPNCEPIRLEDYTG